MTDTITGGCHCGQVRYVVTRPPVTQMICHCKGCLNRTGPYTGAMFVPREATEISGDCNVYHTVGGSGCTVETHRCSGCGAFVGCWAEAVSLIWLVPAASLDDDRQFKPEFHNWVSTKPPWVSIDDDLPQFERSVRWDQLGGRPDFGTDVVKRR